MKLLIALGHKNNNYMLPYPDRHVHLRKTQWSFFFFFFFMSDLSEELLKFVFNGL